MNPERWQRIDELFRTVADRPPAEREVYLTRVCRGDEELRREVLELLAHETADSFLHDPIKHATLAVTSELADELIGQHIGPYRLTRLIGRGGMGTVYEALRDDQQFEQRVALKLIRRGMDSTFVRDRFLRERQILASLEHPHIARLFDGGTTVEGRPYFVMEFVAGEPITDYCRQRELSLEAKLKLFRAVCAAVQHAHQKLVVHRDLKPSNILVAPSEAGKEGTPKLLDFGIAKLLTPDLGEARAQTETAIRLMTPEYASPEQVRGGAITTATDVYALGVVLYELLTDRRPYQFETFAPLEIERAICDTEVARPSEVVTPALKLGRRLIGDLDNIVMMAMRKEPARRYQSVEQFSEDIQRHLTGLPVVARKDTFGYRAEKFMRRHKVGLVFLLLLVWVVVGMAIQSLRIAQERDRANQAAVTAEAVTQSLLAMFEFADPGKSRGTAISARELLDQGTEQIVRELKTQPEVQAKLLDTLGGLYQNIGVYDRAQPLLEEALKLRQQTFGAEHLDVATSMHNLGGIAYLKGENAKSEQLFGAALAMRRKLLGAEHLKVADSQDELGIAFIASGKLVEAEPLLRNALTTRRKLLGEQHADVGKSLTSLGRLTSEQGKFAEAADLYRQALTLRRQLFGVYHPLVALSLNNLAAMLEELEEFAEAELLYRDALAMRRKLLGEEHPDYIVSLANLASVLHYQKEYTEAEQLYRQVLVLRRKLLGDNHPRLAITMNNLATLLQERGSYDEAETLFRQSLVMRRKLLGETHPETATSTNNLACLLQDRAKYQEAEKLFRAALDLYAKSLKPDHVLVQRCRSNLGGCLIKQKRFREAEELLLPAYTGLKAARGEQHEITRKAATRLSELYDVWGKPAQAESYRALSKNSSHKIQK